jgi:ethanolamine utilization protein EutN
MYLGRVVGCVWATVKTPSMEGERMLIVQPLTPDLRNTGKLIVCFDSTGAGAGEVVYWVRGKEASFPFLPKEVPADTTIVGIVDSIDVGPRNTPAPVAGEAPGKPPRKGRKR